MVEVSEYNMNKEYGDLGYEAFNSCFWSEHFIQFEYLTKGAQEGDSSTNNFLADVEEQETNYFTDENSTDFKPQEMIISPPVPVDEYTLNASSNSYLSSPSSPESEESSQSSSQGASRLKPLTQAVVTGSAIYQLQNGSSIPHQQQYIFLDEKQVELLKPRVRPSCLMTGEPLSSTLSPKSSSHNKILHKQHDRHDAETLEENPIGIYRPIEDESKVPNTSDSQDSSEEENGTIIGNAETEDEEENSQNASQEISELDCPLPNLLSETGKYGFKVILDDKEDTLKTPTWLMSKITKKLYTNMNKAIPFRVVLKKRYPKKAFFLRAMAVFKYPMFLRQNVVRCPNHLNPNDPTNVDFTHTNHVIRADHPRAIYECSPSGRLSVLVPLGFPENRNEAVPVLLKFMCHNSCVGGISRRPLAVLLSLELNGEEVGRYTVDVRVCACPSRDVKTEENHMMVKGLHKKMGDYYYEERRGRKRPKKEVFEDENLYFLQVRGLKLFKYLQEIKALYLKTHPDYAAQFPDFPADSIRAELESSQEDGDTSERGGSSAASPSSPLPVVHQQQPPPAASSASTKVIPASSTSSLAQESQRSLIFIYAKSGERVNSPLVTATEPQDATGVPSANVSGAYLTKTPLLCIKQEGGSADSGAIAQKLVKVEIPTHKGAAAVAPAQAVSAKPDAKCSSFKCKGGRHSGESRAMVRSNSVSAASVPPTSSSLAMIKMNSFSGTTKMLTSETISNKPKPHLQVQSMPDKGKKALLTVVPKQMYQSSPSKRGAGSSVLKRALQKGSPTIASISNDENEKVMLAAEVLASNLGSAHVVSK